jgi:hypothetical protein
MAEAPDLEKLAEDSYNVWIEKLKLWLPWKFEEPENRRKFFKLWYIQGAQDIVKRAISDINKNSLQS